MSNLKNLFKKAVIGAQRATMVKGKVGLVVPGGTTIVDVPGQPGRIYVQIQRTEGVTVVTALNNGTTRTAGSDVILQEAAANAIGLTGDTEYVVVGQQVINDADVQVPDANVPPHDHDFGSGMTDYISARRYLPGLVFRKTDMIAKVNAFWYRTEAKTVQYFPGGTVDLTSSIPGTPFQHCWCVVSINEATNAIAVETTTAVGLDTPLTAAMIEALDLGHLPLAAVRLRAGMVKLPADKKNGTDWMDLRNVLSGGASSMPAGDVAKNLFWAGPVTDPAAPASFRVIASADLTAALTTPPPIGATTRAAGSFSVVTAGDTVITDIHTASQGFIIRAAADLGLFFQRLNGDLTTPTAVLSGYSLGSISAGSWITGSSYGQYADIEFLTTQDHSSTNRGTQIVIRTTTNNTNARTVRLAIDHNGQIVHTPDGSSTLTLADGVITARKTSNSDHHQYVFARSRASNAAVQGSDVLGEIIWQGMASSGGITGTHASIKAIAVSNFTGTSKQTKIEFYATPVNATAATLVGAIDDGGTGHDGTWTFLGAQIRPVSGSNPGLITVLPAASGVLGGRINLRGGTGFQDVFIDRTSDNIRIYRNDAGSASTLNIGQLGAGGDLILSVDDALIIPTAAPGTLTNGNIWYDNTQKTLVIRSGGLSEDADTTFFIQTSAVTVGNTATESTLVSDTSAIGTRTIPANYNPTGKVLSFVMRGRIRGDFSTNTLFFRFKIDTTTIATISINAGSATLNTGFELRGEFRTTGSGTEGAMTLLISGHTPYINNFVAGTISWSSARVPDITADWASVVSTDILTNLFLMFRFHK